MITIWAKNIREQKNHSVAFFYKGKLPNNSQIEIAAANAYRLFVNGELLGYGPARAYHKHTRKDVYNLTNMHNSKTTIVVEVFAANVNSYYLIDEPPFFGACIIDGEKTIANTLDFKAFILNDRVQKVQRYSYQRPFAESYKMEKCRSAFCNGDSKMFNSVETEVVNSNIIIDRNIDYPNFKKVPFIDEIEFGEVTKNSQNPKYEGRELKVINENLKGFQYDELQECLSDEMSEFDYKIVKETNKNNLIGSNNYKLFAFGRTLTGFINLKAKANQNTTFYIIWDEVVLDEENKNKPEKNICFYRNTCCNIIKYELKKGTYNLLSFEPTSLKYAKIIVIEGEIEINDFSVVLYENKNAYNLIFDSNDRELNEIVKAAANTFSQNAVDVLTDCPSRERAGWLCDSYFSGRAEKLFTGKNEIERNFLENYCLSPQLEQLPNGMLPMCYPCDHYDGVYIPNWSMWFVLELNDYYKRTNDLELINIAKEKVYNLIDFFKNYINKDGLLENLESWVFIEWSKCNDEEYIKGVNYPSNMLYSAMLKAAGELYGDNNLIDKSSEINRVIIEQSFNGEFFEDNRVRENGVLQSKNHLTETCQYYAFYFGVARKEDFAALFEIMIEKFGPFRDIQTVYPNIAQSNAIVGNYLRLEILLENGLYKKVLDECKAFFTKMAERTSTLWEHSFVSGSLNHGFASIAANYIVEAFTGYGLSNCNKDELKLNDTFEGKNAIVTIPVLNEKLEIIIENGKRNINLIKK